MQDAEQLVRSLPERAAPAADVALRVQRNRAIGAMVLVALPFLVFWPSTESLLVRWRDTELRTYTHGLLVVALSLWMIWRGRSRWSGTVRTFPAGIAASVALGLLWLIAYRAGLQIVHQALLPMIAFAAVTTCFGPHLARRMWLPIAFLYFAIPVWDAINPALQWISVFAVRLLLRLFGIPAYFSGDTFHIPAGTFEIASGCSGLHFFAVATTIAVLYGEINNDHWKTRGKLFLLAAVLAMVTNWLRVFIIVLAGHLTDMQHYLVSGEHYSFGWFMFAGTMIAYFLIVRRWPLLPASATVPGSEDSPTGIPRAGFALAIAAILPVAALSLFDANIAAASGEILPARVPGWESSASSPTDWQPVFKGADAEQRLAYRAAGRAVDGYAATYLQQRQGKEAVSYENSPLGSGLTAEGRTQTAARGWQEVRANDSRGERWLVWYMYRMDERWYSTPLDLQLAYGVRSLLSAPLTSVIAVRTPCGTDCENARESLGRFTEAAWQ
jgi:EpsI family protein